MVDCVVVARVVAFVVVERVVSVAFVGRVVVVRVVALVVERVVGRVAFVGGVVARAGALVVMT